MIWNEITDIKKHGIWTAFVSTEAYERYEAGGEGLSN